MASFDHRKNLDQSETVFVLELLLAIDDLGDHERPEFVYFCLVQVCRLNFAKMEKHPYEDVNVQVRLCELHKSGHDKLATLCGQGCLLLLAKFAKERDLLAVAHRLDPFEDVLIARIHLQPAPSHLRNQIVLELAQCVIANVEVLFLKVCPSL